MRIIWSKTEPGEVTIEDIGAGGLFKTRRGNTPYMRLHDHEPDGLTLVNKSSMSVFIVCVSLESGQLHIFEPMHPVVELDATLELKKVR